MLKNRNKQKDKSETVFQHSSKVTLGVNTIIFFSLGIQHMKNMNSSVLTNMYVYTYFQQEYLHKLVFKLVNEL